MLLTSLPLRAQQVQILQRSLWRTYSAEVLHRELAGTVASHSSYILLNTRIPPPSFPNRVSSKLQRTLQLHTNRWGGLVNLAWSPDTPPSPVGTPEWESGDERYSLVAFSARRGFISIPEVNMQNVEDVAEKLREHALPPTSSTRPSSIIDKVGQQDEPIHIYVCTHGERDCRCGETGGAVFDAFRQEVQRRSLQSLVKVGGVGHVGGHKYAANALVFPYGDWLGYLTPSNVPEVLDNILSLHKSSPFSSFSVSQTPPLCPNFWRGRMGLNKEEQLQLIHPSAAHPDKDLSAQIKPHARS